MGMIEIGMGSVQTWECDYMDHLNVQHYVARASEALAGLATALGIGPKYGREHGVSLTALDHHIRFLRELRPGAPFVFIGGILEVRRDTLKLYQEMRNTQTGEVAASFVTEAALLDRTASARHALPADVAKRAEVLRATLPDYAAPKGIDFSAPRTAPTWDEAERLGLMLIQQGVVNAAECDGQGFMTTRAYMGRVSDGIPNLIARTGGADRARKAGIGGAALEYRFVYRAVPREGDVLALRSGIKALNGKTIVWVHWLFDRESGTAVATAEAVGVNFDLVARKAVDISDTARREMQRYLVPALSA